MSISLNPITRGSADWDTTVNNNLATIQTAVNNIQSSVDNILLPTVHNLTFENNWGGVGKVVTFKIGQVPFASVSIVARNSVSIDSSNISTYSSIVDTPDISSDQALAGTSFTMDWKYFTASIWQSSETLRFAFYDGYGNLNLYGGSQTVPAGCNIMIFATWPLV